MKAYMLMEIHDAASPEYSKFFKNNKCDAIIGLSATIERKTTYEINGNIVTKGQLLDKIAPVCFKYTMEEANVDKTSRKLKVYVIITKLEEKKKTVKGGSKKKPFLQTESSAYTYWDKAHKRAFFLEDQELRSLKIGQTAKRRSEIIYNAIDKVRVTRELLDNIKGKSIIFANSLNSLLQVTPNVISSRNSEKENDRIRNAFEKGLIQAIGSFKKLKQGANLSNLDNCLIMSYYSMNKDFIQRVGRLRDNGEVGNVFILLTQGTQEEIWFNKMIEDMQHLDIKYYSDLKLVINELNTI